MRLYLAIAALLIAAAPARAYDQQAVDMGRAICAQKLTSVERPKWGDPVVTYQNGWQDCADLERAVDEVGRQDAAAVRDWEHQAIGRAIAEARGAK